MLNLNVLILSLHDKISVNKCTTYIIFKLVNHIAYLCTALEIYNVSQKKIEYTN